MKTIKLINVAGVFFVLVLTTTTVLAQGRRAGNGYYQNQRNYCLNYISGLSETQQEQIQQMVNNHQQTMAELRTKRRSTVNAVEKSEIRTEMLKNVETHREAVKNVLTDEQQKQYDQLHIFGNYGRNQNIDRGQRNFAGRGNGGRGFYSNCNFRGVGNNSALTGYRNGNWNCGNRNFRNRW